MKKVSAFKVLALGSMMALTAVSAVSFAASAVKHTGFYGISVPKRASISTSVNLAHPYTSRIDNNTASKISWSAGGRKFTIGADDTQLVVNDTRPPPSEADIKLYDQFVTQFDLLQVPNRACVEVDGPSSGQVSIKENCLQ